MRKIDELGIKNNRGNLIFIFGVQTMVIKPLKWLYLLHRDNLYTSSHKKTARLFIVLTHL